MAPVVVTGDTSSKVDSLISSNRVMLFSKMTCPFCIKVKGLFADKGLNDANIVELDQVIIVKIIAQLQIRLSI
jgi:hypothetical protein